MAPSGNEYFKHTRRDIAPLLPPEIGRVLEVGCGAGHTLRWLKEEHSTTATFGVEPTTTLAGELEKNTDQFIIGSAETADFEKASFDTILFLDVLEHMIDPWSVLERYRDFLAPGGSIIASIPNVAHYKVSLPLLLRRDWRYFDAGIMDRTHLRFFVKETIFELFEKSDLKINSVLRLLGPYSNRLGRYATKVFGDAFSERFVIQYIVRAQLEQSPDGEPEQKDQWTGSDGMPEKT